MTRKQVIASTYVVAAGLLLALGAAARHSQGGPGQSTPTQSAGRAGRGMMGGQMGQGMMGQNQGMMAVQRKMRNLIDELMQNQEAMEKAKSVRSMKPLLGKNRALLDRLNDEMAQSWGMHERMYGAGMSGSMGARGPARRTSGTAPARNAEESGLAARGKEVFRAHACSICHGETGKGTKAGPSLVGVGKKYSDEKIAELIRRPATPKMPAFSSSAMSEADLKAVIAYLEQLK